MNQVYIYKMRDEQNEEDVILGVFAESDTKLDEKQGVWCAIHKLEDFDETLHTNILEGNEALAEST